VEKKCTGVFQKKKTFSVKKPREMHFSCKKYSIPDKMACFDQNNRVNPSILSLFFRNHLYDFALLAQFAQFNFYFFDPSVAIHS
jgi:hypothetical protein